MLSVERELAAGSDPWPTAEMVGRLVVGHWTLAGGGESRRPEGVRNPTSKGFPITEPPSGTETETETGTGARQFLIPNSSF